MSLTAVVRREPDRDAVLCDAAALALDRVVLLGLLKSAVDASRFLPAMFLETERGGKDAPYPRRLGLGCAANDEIARSAFTEFSCAVGASIATPLDSKEARGPPREIT